MFEQQMSSSVQPLQPQPMSSNVPPQQPQPIPVRSTTTDMPPWMNNRAAAPVLPLNGGQSPVSPIQQTSLAQRVYTIPEKFLPKVHQQPIHSGTKRLIIIIGIILAILIILVAALVYFLQTRASLEEQPNPNVPSISTSNQNVNSNANQNQNTNQTSNQNNTNTVTANGNENLNANVNAQLFPNQNQNTNNTVNGNNMNSNTNSPLIIASRSNVVDAADKDRDGLTDEEEASVYKTKSNLPDTDSDGYVDATEIIHLFSPLNAKQTLIESGLVIQEKNKDFGWNIYYPANWLAEKLNENAREVLFTPDTIEGEYMEVIVEDNNKKQSAAEWYASLYTNMKPQDVKTATVGGMQGIE